MDALLGLAATVAEPELKVYLVQSRVARWMMEASVSGDKAGEPRVKGLQRWFSEPAVVPGPATPHHQVRMLPLRVFGASRLAWLTLAQYI